MNKAVYIAELQPNAESFHVFNWGDAANFPSGGSWEYIIYDEKDPLYLPEKARSAEWNKANGGWGRPLGAQCKKEIRPLGEHFFYVKDEC